MARGGVPQLSANGTEVALRDAYWFTNDRGYERLFFHVSHFICFDQRPDFDAWAQNVRKVNNLYYTKGRHGSRLPNARPAGSETVDSSAASEAGLRSSHGGPYG